MFDAFKRGKVILAFEPLEMRSLLNADFGVFDLESTDLKAPAPLEVHEVSRFDTLNKVEPARVVEPNHLGFINPGLAEHSHGREAVQWEEELNWNAAPPKSSLASRTWYPSESMQAAAPPTKIFLEFIHITLVSSTFEQADADGGAHQVVKDAPLPLRQTVNIPTAAVGTTTTTVHQATTKVANLLSPTLDSVKQRTSESTDVTPASTSRSNSQALAEGAAGLQAPSAAGNGANRLQFGPRALTDRVESRVPGSPVDVPTELLRNPLDVDTVLEYSVDRVTRKPEFNLLETPRSRQMVSEQPTVRKLIVDVAQKIVPSTGALVSSGLEGDYAAIDLAFSQLLTELDAMRADATVLIDETNLRGWALPIAGALVVTAMSRHQRRARNREQLSSADDDLAIWMYPEYSGLSTRGLK